jgi:serine carboxypeptidase-like clade 2
LVLHNRGAGGSGDAARGRALFYYGKGLFSTTLKDTIEKECGSLFYPSGPGWAQQTPACSKALQTMSTVVGPHNFYNLDDFCSAPESGSQGGATIEDWVASMAPRADGSLPRMDALAHERPTCPGAVDPPNDDACATVEGFHDGPLGEAQLWCGVDRSMSAWLATPEVIEALHVKSPKGTEKNNLHYTGGYRDGDLRSLYKELAEQYRLWIYNGQEDGCIPYTGAEEWTSHLGFPVTSEWHPWFGDADAGGSRVAAGYATSYGAPAKDFAFVTVKGAGHEVPTYKPAAAFKLFSNFINGTQL